MWQIVLSFFLLAFISGEGLAQTGTGVGSQQHSGSFHHNSAGTEGSTDTLPGGFRRFRDSSGNTGILQRTPNSGFPNSQFIAPIAPALPPSIPMVGQPPPSQAPPPTRLPQTLRPENLPPIPGLPIGPQNR